MPGDAREVAVSIVRVLRESGQVAYLAGGCVRDEVLGLAPKDYDVATDATPERIAGLFKRTREVGRAFGVMQVHLHGVSVEVATFRREHGYSDGRRPDAVSFTGAEEDASRRDFTINALFIDPLAPESEVRGVRVRGRVIDFVQGLKDIESGIIRAVGDPEARLAEDNLRALRAVRFAARLGFSVEVATAAAVKRHASELAGVSRERIGDELRRMLIDERRVQAAELIESLALDAPALLEPPRGTGALSVLASLPPRVGFVAALAAWEVDRARTPGNPAEAVARLRRALCLSNEESDGLRDRLAGHRRLLDEWPGLSVAQRKRAAASDWFGDAWLLARGVHPAAAALVQADVHALAQTEGGVAPQPLITGDDLVAAGARPGKGFGGWLDQVYDAQLEGRVTSRDEALALALQLAGVNRH